MINRQTITRTLLTALLAFTAGQGTADDTEIYVGDAEATNGVVLPNVLFIIDTTRSMTNKDTTEPPVSRIDRVKEALRKIIIASNNVKMGLMIMHSEGGPVLYPVSSLTDAAAAIDNEGGKIDVPISAGEDDAEESSVGTMTLDNPNIFLLDRIVGFTLPVTRRISHNNDDAIEVDGAFNRGSASLMMAENNMIGLRFLDVDIPDSATIDSASIEFTVDNTTGLSEPLAVKIYGVAHKKPANFRNANNRRVSDRPKTTEATATGWDVPTDLSVGDTFSTPDIKDAIAEITTVPNWASGNAMMFIIDGQSGDGSRSVTAYNGNHDKAAQLQINFTDDGTTDTQKAGFRFRNVAIPQGATITSAHLEFTAAVDDSDDASMTIRGVASDDAVVFANTSSFLSGRTLTSAKKDWDDIPSWTQETIYQTPDITSVVQEIVNRNGWCGGNSMAFVLAQNSDNDDAQRLAYSYDGDTTKVPRLRIEYDENITLSDTVNGCINQTFQTQVIAGSDDVEERSDGTMVSNTSKPLDLVKASNTTGNQTVGIRFREVNVPKDATILEASLTFTARSIDSGTTSITIKGHAADDSGAFSTTDNSISDRYTNNPTNHSVTWSASSTPALTSWSTTGVEHVSPDLGLIINDITSRPGWQAGNDMSFLITGTGRRRAHSYDSSPISSPVLKIKVQGKLGTSYTTVRDRLLNIVDTLGLTFGTPVRETLYEAANYWRGGPVIFGKTRGYGHTLADGTRGDAATGSFSKYHDLTRLSHPASYTGGQVEELNDPDNCPASFPGSTDCLDEYISGSPTYISPIEQWCQPNHQILLSDGLPYQDGGNTLVNDMLGGGTCANNDACTERLVEYLHKEDQIPSLDKSQSIFTHTIGLNMPATDDDYLEALASKGGGDFKTAASADELADSFNALLAGILSQNTSFSAPAVSVNAFNKLYHDNEIYFSLFLPKRQKRWPGNLKKFGICQGNPNDTCTKGEVLDADNLSALTGNGTFEPNARSIWSSADDGNQVMVGGAGAEIPANPGGRAIYTYTGSSTPDNVDLNTADYKITETDKDALATDALRSGLDSGGALSDADFEKLIYWILGRDVNDETESGSTTDDRWALGDALHGSPVIITFGKEGGGSVIKKVFMGTNDGGLHMFNAETGVEEWLFMPQALLDKQVDLMNNNDGDHIYGIDGHITHRIKDVDGDGIIEYSDGDRVYIFFGMRRGGRNYYALDVTPTSPLTSASATGGITPTLKWRIEGGTTTGFEYLGDTWSAPLVSTVRVSDGTGNGGSTTKDVLIFGGGYDETSQDNGFSTGTPGNAIYIVNIEDGSREWWAGPSDSGADMVLGDMTYPIPSTVALLDSDHDGYDDRIYVGDTGGQLWRIYLGYMLGDDTQSGGRLATVSSTSSDSEKRKFFYRPDVAKVSDSQYSSTADYDLVTIVSGDRSFPTETTVHNQVYAFRDYATAGGLPDNFTPLTPATNLYDATANLIQNTNGSEDTTEVASLKTKSGWYINLNEPGTSNWIGEKGLSRTLILDGKLLFTTFIPTAAESGTPDTCGSPLGGYGRFYVIDALNATAVYPNWDGAGDSSNYTRTDRTYDSTLPGIPSEPVPVFQKTGVTVVIGGGGGGFVFDPDVDLPKIETFWYEEQ
ncbi:MAG: PilC/PilY family type IV pilus protein [Candidatus Sedimenticola sp. (ex Thyasira tokunagai)]